MFRLYLLMVCTFRFAREVYWSSKPISIMEVAVSLQFYLCYLSYFIANQFGFHSLTTTCKVMAT